MAELPARVRCRGGSRVCRGGRALGSAWAGPRPSERPRLGHVAGSVGACGSPGARSPAVLEPQRLAAQALILLCPLGRLVLTPCFLRSGDCSGFCCRLGLCGSCRFRKHASTSHRPCRAALFGPAPRRKAWDPCGRRDSQRARAAQVPGQSPWLSGSLCWKATS